MRRTAPWHVPLAAPLTSIDCCAPHLPRCHPVPPCPPAKRDVGAARAALQHMEQLTHDSEARLDALCRGAWVHPARAGPLPQPHSGVAMAPGPVAMCAAARPVVPAAIPGQGRPDVASRGPHAEAAGLQLQQVPHGGAGFGPAGTVVQGPWGLRFRVASAMAHWPARPAAAAGPAGGLPGAAMGSGGGDVSCGCCGRPVDGGDVLPPLGAYQAGQEAIVMVRLEVSTHRDGGGSCGSSGGGDAGAATGRSMPLRTSIVQADLLLALPGGQALAGACSWSGSGAGGGAAGQFELSGGGGGGSSGLAGGAGSDLVVEGRLDAALLLEAAWQQRLIRPQQGQQQRGRPQHADWAGGFDGDGGDGGWMGVAVPGAAGGGAGGEDEGLELLELVGSVQVCVEAQGDHQCGSQGVGGGWQAQGAHAAARARADGPPYTSAVSLGNGAATALGVGCARAVVHVPIGRVPVTHLGSWTTRNVLDFDIGAQGAGPVAAVAATAGAGDGAAGVQAAEALEGCEAMLSVLSRLLDLSVHSVEATMAGLRTPSTAPCASDGTAMAGVAQAATAATGVPPAYGLVGAAWPGQAGAVGLGAAQRLLGEEMLALMVALDAAAVHLPAAAAT